MDDSIDIYVADIQKVTHLSPEPALCIWVAGCSVRCEGCINKHLWEKESGKRYSQTDLRDLIRDSFEDDKSLTTLIFSGGEPLDQADAIYDLVSSLRYPSKGIETIILFTGKEEIKYSLIEGGYHLFDAILIGKYKGSENGIADKIILSDKAELISFYRELEKQKVVEVIIKEDRTLVTGFEALKPNTFRVGWQETQLQFWEADVEAETEEEAICIMQDWDDTKFSPELMNENCIESLQDVCIVKQE